MRDKYEEELKKLNSSISQMGKMIELAIESSVISLMGRDIESAKAVRLNDYAINDMEREIENQCMKLLLQQQADGRRFKNDYCSSQNDYRHGKNW